MGEFIASLYRLVEHCNYGTLKEEMIRDRLVVGLTDNTLSERLQMRPDLTLTQAVEMVRNSELVKKQRAVIREPEQRREVDFVKRKQKDQHDKKGSKLCSWCGSNTSHERSRCPANNNRCLKCGKLGHFKKVCRSRGVTSIETNSAVSHEATEKNCFMGTVTQPNFSIKPTIDVYVNSVKLNFRIDSGADVTVISNETFDLINKTKLFPCEQILTGPQSDNLVVTGKFNAKLETDNFVSEQCVYVVEKLKQSLLGWPAIKALNIFSNVNSVVDAKEFVKLRFPKVFSGLGKLGDPYQIKSNLGAKPFCIANPKRIPLPLEEAVKLELKNMEEQGVISKVTRPTDWCSGMVVVPKANGKVRICVDYTKLSKYVCRELHILPTVNETLSKLSGAKVSRSWMLTRVFGRFRNLTTRRN